MRGWCISQFGLEPPSNKKDRCYTRHVTESQNTIRKNSRKRSASNKRKNMIMSHETLITNEEITGSISFGVKQRETLWSFVENERPSFESIKSARLMYRHSVIKKSAIYQYVMVVFLFAITLSLQPIGSDACSASPFPFRQQLPNNALEEQILYLHGDASYNYLTDINGFTVMRNEYGMLVYARRSNSSGSLMATDRQKK